MMRIAYVINSLEGGGAALPVPAIAQVMRDAGAEVHIFALTRRNGRAEAAIVAAGFACSIGPAGERDQLAAWRWLDRAVAAWRPTHIWTSLTRATVIGQLVGLKRRVPVVSWQHNALLRPANLALLRATRRLSMLWVGDSRSVAALTIERLGVPCDRVATWPIFAADPAAPRARPWQPGMPVAVGSLGRLHRNKGYDVLIAALAMLDADGFVPPVPYRIMIAGEGGLRAPLIAAAAAAGVADRIVFAGYADRPRDFLAAQHLYVQPSRHEGFCIAAHEAMQAGLAVLGTETGEMPHSIDRGITGDVVPPGDPRALADGFARLIGDPASLAALGDAARARVLDRYSNAAFASAGQAILARLR
jgi:glycosyltransferase involved in cell wall biosynthesis